MQSSRLLSSITIRGEATDVAENEKGYLKSIFMAFQREVIWISDVGEDYFLAKQINH
jgi:hypothetical protein